MSLWDEYDNQVTLTAGAHSKQTRRFAGRAIVSSTRKWLLQDYAAAFCRALAATRLYRRCYWVDAWGIDQQDLKSARATPLARLPAVSTGDQQPSPDALPVIQAINSLSQALAQEDKPLAFKGLLLASGSSRHRGALQNGAAAQTAKTRNELLTLPKESGILRAHWPEIAPALLKEIEHVPAIFLLNPCGQTLFTYDDLAMLYQRSSAPTELCLLLAHRQIELHVVAASRSAEYAASLTALLRTDRWKALLGKEAGSTFNAESIVDLLQASLRQHFRWVQPISLAIQRRPAIVELAPYTLLFASRHKDSLVSMNDALCVHRRRLYAQSRQGILGEDWFAKQEQERFAEDIQQLLQRTAQLGRAQRTRRWPDLRQQLLLENFGQFTLQDYDAVICGLLLDNQVRCEWRQSALAIGTQQRIPGSDDTLLWR